MLESPALPTELTGSNDDVQKTMSLSISYNSYDAPSGTNVLVKFQNDAIQALTSLANLASLSNSNYNY